MSTDPFNYIESRADADGLIDDFGTVAFVRRTVNSGTAFDPTQTTTDYATKAVRVEFTWKQIQGGSVLATDQRWLVAAGPLTALGVTSVQTPDKLVVGGVVLPILPTDPLNPAGTVVMFDCHIRV